MGTDKFAGVSRRLEQRRNWLEHPRKPRSISLFWRLVGEARPKIAVENGGPNLEKKVGASLPPSPWGVAFGKRTDGTE